MHVFFLDMIPVRPKRWLLTVELYQDGRPNLGAVARREKTHPNKKGVNEKHKKHTNVIFASFISVRVLVNMCDCVISMLPY